MFWCLPVTFWWHHILNKNNNINNIVANDVDEDLKNWDMKICSAFTFCLVD